MNNDLAQKVASWGASSQTSNDTPTNGLVQKVLSWGNTPSDVSSAQSDQGKQDYNNLCEKFVEQHVYGQTGIFPTAADAWNSYVKDGKAQGGAQNAPAGSMVYFGADKSNGDFGHVAIADGKGNIIGATSNGVQSIPLTDWIKQTGQTPLGFVQP